MNKKIMSLLTIGITITTVVVMMKNSNLYINNKQNSVIAEGNTLTKKESKQNTNICKKTEQNIVKITEANEVKENETKALDSLKDVNTNTTLDNSAKAASNKSTIEVFKVSRNKIAEQLSFMDKAELLLIIKSLAPNDFAKLQEYINDEDEKRGLSNAEQLLKKRLSKEDFNKVQDIAEKFINIDAINSN